MVPDNLIAAMCAAPARVLVAAAVLAVCHAPLVGADDEHQDTRELARVTWERNGHEYILAYAASNSMWTLGADVPYVVANVDVHNLDALYDVWDTRTKHLATIKYVLLFSSTTHTAT